MRGKKRYVFLLLISAIFCIGMVCNIGILIANCHQSNQTTKEISATVRTIERVGETDTPDIVIHTKESSYEVWILSYIIEHIPTASISDLKAGDTIYFRARNWELSDANAAALDEQRMSPYMVFAVSLSTESGIVFTIDDYNRYMMEGATPTLIAGIVLSLVTCFGVAFSIKQLRKA